WRGAGCQHRRARFVSRGKPQFDLTLEGRGRHARHLLSWKTQTIIPNGSGGKGKVWAASGLSSSFVTRLSRGASRLASLLLLQILPVLHPTVQRTHGGDPAVRSSRVSR